MRVFLALSLILAFTVCTFQIRAARAEAPPPAAVGKTLADYEYDFGIWLVNRGFEKLAEAHFTKYLTDPKIPAAKRPMGYLGLAILYKRLGKLPRFSAKEREAYFQKALDNLTEFLTKCTDKNSPEYRSGLVEQYGIQIERVGAKVADISKLSGDARKAEETKTAEELKKAIADLKDIHDKIREEREAYEQKVIAECEANGTEPPEPMVYPEEMEERWYMIGFVLAQAYRLYPEIYLRGTDDFKKAVEMSLLGLQDFVWEHDSDTVYIYGGMYLAELLAYKCLGTKDPKEKEALRGKIDDTMNQYAFFFPVENITTDTMAYLREKAFNKYAEILATIGSTDLIIPKVWTLYVRDYPNWLETTMFGEGYTLGSVVAAIMADNNDALTAVEMLTSIINKAQLRNMFDKVTFASQKLAVIIERLGPEAMDVKTLLQAGKGFKAKGDSDKAIRYYQYVIQKLDVKLDEEELGKLSPAEQKKRRDKFELLKKEIIDIGVEAFSDISECFKDLGLTVEALTAANEIIPRYYSLKDNAKDKEKIGLLIRRQGSVAFNLAREVFMASAKSDRVNKMAAQQLMLAIDNYIKVDPNVRSRMVYERGFVHQQMGSYLPAIESYKTIPQDDDKFGDAQYNICFCFFKLMTDAKTANDEAKTQEYQKMAIDSLANVINMERKWGPGQEAKQRSWERKRSQCFVLLCTIYNNLGMGKELIDLSDKWMAMYKDLAGTKEYKEIANHPLSLYKASVPAALALKDLAKAEDQYKSIKGYVLAGKAAEVAEDKKYDVNEETGQVMVELAGKLAEAFAADEAKRTFYTHETDKFNVVVRDDPYDVYKNEFMKYAGKNDDLALRAGRKLDKMFDRLLAVPFDEKVMRSKEYTDAIYFAGDAAKTESARALYSKFVDAICGTKDKVGNYAAASRTLAELMAADPESKTDIWRKPMMLDVKRKVDFYNMRLNVYKTISPLVMKAGDYEYAVKVLEYVVAYYHKDADKYDLAMAYRKIGGSDNYKLAAILYGQILAPVLKSKEQVPIRYICAQMYFEWAKSLDPVKEKEEVIKQAEAGLRQIANMQAQYPQEITPEMLRLKDQIEAFIASIPR
ncbi:MAG: hypothetical protein WC712_02340 [Candidatus Brocadiia bacterium]